MGHTSFIGPIAQLIPMTGLPAKGSLSDSKLKIIPSAGIYIKNGIIEEVADYKEMSKRISSAVTRLVLDKNYVCLPGFIDAHTHICFAGSRASDYAKRNAGKTYLEIAAEGGGIWDTVTQTRKATKKELVEGILKRAQSHLQNGVTTIEIKSGYGLTVEEELKMLEAIKEASQEFPSDFIPTCLAAHMPPKDFKGEASAYLKMISETLFPLIKERQLTNRIDAFIEQGAFTQDEIRPYLKKAKEYGFDITIHADQFSTGGSEVAVQFEALSADHLEASTSKEIETLAKSNVISMALPGASLGLGCHFTPARKILDAGGSLAIASDHNPGSAPMGDLLTQAAILGSMEKLSNTEVLAGITFRAAAALNLQDRGIITKDYKADLVLFPVENVNEILYQQGGLKPHMVFKDGQLVYQKNKA